MTDDIFNTYSKKKNNIHINITIRNAGRKVCISCVRTEKNLFSALSGKGLGLPHYLLQGGPFQGLGWGKKIILAPLRYFLSPSLAQKGNPRGRRPSKIGKTHPDGIIHS